MFSTRDLTNLRGTMVDSILHVPMQNSGLLVDVTDVSSGNGHHAPTRRGRRSLLSVEQREQNRRVKKQNIERRRRACISDKMTDLHRLAMSMIGCEKPINSKTEKADILGTCHKIFQSFASLIREHPEMKAKLLELTTPLRERLLSMNCGNRRHEQVSECIDYEDAIIDVENIDPFNFNLWDNVVSQEDHPSPFHLAVKPSRDSALAPHAIRPMQSTPLQTLHQITPDSGTSGTNRSWMSNRLLLDPFHSPVDLKLNCRYRNQLPCTSTTHSNDSGLSISEDSIYCSIPLDSPHLNKFGSLPEWNSEKDNKLWRPYLD